MDGHALQTFRDKMKISNEEETILDIPEDESRLLARTHPVMCAIQRLYLPPIRDSVGIVLER